ncbi:CybS-domain-containing protein [Geopyxis carbonaria]|nr:CybS-domain-containing protein [Geopyxis carbonaria]
MSFLRPSTFRSAAAARPLVQSRVFSSTQKRAILPAGPQSVEGTVNDPAFIPATNMKEGSYHWSFERLLSVGLIPLTIAPFAAGSMHPVFDATLAAATIMHSHIGFQSCIADYIPKRKYPKSNKSFKWLLNGASVLVLYGLYEFETNDVGVTEGVKRIWKA